MVVLLVGIVIGVMVFWEINQSLSFSHHGPTTGAPLAVFNSTMTTWSSINSTASTVFTMAPIIAIVGIAGIILAIIIGFGQGGRGQV